MVPKIVLEDDKENVYPNILGKEKRDSHERSRHNNYKSKYSKTTKKHHHQNTSMIKDKCPSKEKRPAIFEPLSPKALYPRPPSRNFLTTSCKSPTNELPIIKCHGSGEMITSSTNGGTSGSGSSGAGGAGGNGGGIGMDSGIFGVVGGGNGTKGVGNGNKNNGGRSTDIDLDSFEYPDSPTSQKWLENPDLIPLTVLDNINLKTEFPYATNTNDIDKPPDINSINLDHLPNADNLFQFTASIPPPVPDSTATNFLDISGNDTDSFSQSLYDDLVDINLADFPNVGSMAPPNASSVASTLAISTSPSTSIVTTLNGLASMPPTSNLLSSLAPTTMDTNCQPQTRIMLPAKPLALDKLDQNMATSALMANLSKLKAELPPLPNQTQLSQAISMKPTFDIGSLNLSLLPITAQAAVAALAQVSNAPPPVTILSNPNLQNTPPPPVIKNIVEPLPASALKDFIKVEPDQTMENSGVTTIHIPATQQPQQLVTTPTCFNIKIENNNNNQMTFPLSSSETVQTIFTPLTISGTSCNIIGTNGLISTSPDSPPSSVMSPQSIGGGKMKSSLTRKKSTCSTSSNASTGSGSGAGEGTIITTLNQLSTNGTQSANDEEDISNIPSLQMRIQIISQRVSLI